MNKVSFTPLNELEKVEEKEYEQWKWEMESDRDAAKKATASNEEPIRRRIGEILAVNEHFSKLFSHYYYRAVGLNRAERALNEKDLEVIAAVRDVLNKEEITETTLVVTTKLAVLAAIAVMLDELGYDLVEANELARKVWEVALRTAKELKRVTE